MTLCDRSMPGFPALHYLPEFAWTHVHRVCDAIQPSHPLSPPSPAFNLSRPLGSFPMSRCFPSGGQKYWSFSFSPSNEYLGLISFRIDWFDLLAVQGTLKSLLHHHSLKASILQLSAFFMVQLSHPYMTTRKNRAFTRQTSVRKLMSLPFSKLSKFVMAFIPRSKHLLISWLQSPSSVILESKKIECHCFHVYPLYLPWSDGTRCHISSWMLSFKPAFSLLFHLHQEAL